MVARVNPDGTLDEGFTLPQTELNPEAFAIAIQPNGKILVGGEFDSYSGTPCGGLVRLNTDGTLDDAFSLGPATPSGSGIRAIVLLPDGKILIGGRFSSYQGVDRKSVARLNEDGTVDMSFDAGNGAEYNEWLATVNAMALRPDGRVVIGGDFTLFNGVARGGIAQLSADGALDPAFAQGAGGTDVRTLALLPDGAALVGGWFSTFHGSEQGGIVQLDSTGALDPTFEVGTGAGGGISSIVCRQDGRVLLGGRFETFNGEDRSNIALLEADGTLSPLFSASAGTYQPIVGLSSLPDGRVLAVGDLSAAAGIGRRCMAMYAPDGSLDTSFGSISTGVNGPVTAIALQPDGQSIIAGYFGACNGVQRPGIARLSTTGELDPTFNVQADPDYYPSMLGLQPDGKCIVLGWTWDFAHYVIKRLNPDGSVDPSFNPWPGFATMYNVRCMLVLPDGKFLLGGGFDIVGSSTWSGLARFNADGSLDTTFEPMGTYVEVRALALQPDGKILVGGQIWTWNGTPAINLVRLFPNGTLESSFYAPNTLGNYALGVVALAVTPDGHILAMGGGDINGAYRVVRLLPSGTLDPSLVAGAGFTLSTNMGISISSLIPQAAGGFVVTGSFDTYNGATANNIARLNADGSLDAGFASGTGPDALIRCAAVQPDGNILIGGDFTSYNGTGRNRLARVIGDDLSAIDKRTAGNTSTLAIWPNPNRDGRLNIAYSGADMKASAANVVVLDACGKQVLSRALSVPGATLETTLDLGPLANGVYEVRMTTAGHVHATRLVVGP